MDNPLVLAGGGAGARPSMITQAEIVKWVLLGKVVRPIFYRNDDIDSWSEEYKRDCPKCGAPRGFCCNLDGITALCVERGAKRDNRKKR